MEYRKIIKFGNSSHVVSLPSYWLKRNKLNKGDLIYFEENGNNELIFSPRVKDSKKELNKIVIDSTNKDLSDINREIISKYIAGYDLIEISDNSMEKRSADIRNLIHNLMGMEIMFQDKKRIVARDLLDLKSISLKNIINRIDIIIRSMLEDSKATITEDHYNSIYNRDKDVNRLSFLAHKVIKKCILNPNIARELSVDNLYLLNSWQLLINLEKIGDEAKRISRFFKDLNLKNKESEQLLKIYSKIIESYLNVMKAYYKDDKKIAYEIALTKDKIIEECNNISEKSKNPKICRVIERIKGMEVYVRNISRVVFDKSDMYPLLNDKNKNIYK